MRSRGNTNRLRIVLELERGLATIPLSGIGVPFHSCYLWSGVMPFRACKCNGEEHAGLGNELCTHPGSASRSGDPDPKNTRRACAPTQQQLNLSTQPLAFQPSTSRAHATPPSYYSSTVVPIDQTVTPYTRYCPFFSKCPLSFPNHRPQNPSDYSTSSADATDARHLHTLLDAAPRRTGFIGWEANFIG